MTPAPPGDLHPQRLRRTASPAAVGAAGSVRAEPTVRTARSGGLASTGCMASTGTIVAVQGTGSAGEWGGGLA